MPHCRKLLLYLFCALPCLQAEAQMYSNDSLSDRLYMYKVKSVDEFIERFNDDQQSFLRTALKQQQGDVTVTRPQMMIQLFDMQKKDWDREQLKRFLGALINDSVHYRLSFTDSNWIAVAQCRFRLNDREVVIPIRLRIKNNQPLGARWVICGLTDAAQLPASVADNSMPGPADFRFIPSSSHSTGFLYLHDAFRDREHLPVYFEEAFLSSRKADRLIQALASGRLSFIHVDTLDFYFFQINDWVFKVSNRERNMMNHGWLITDLFPVPDILKNAFFR